MLPQLSGQEGAHLDTPVCLAWDTTLEQNKEMETIGIFFFLAMAYWLDSSGSQNFYWQASEGILFLFYPYTQFCSLLLILEAF